jgi:hypothetical protein
MVRGKRYTIRREWTANDERKLKKHSKNKTPVEAIAKSMNRTPGAIRQKAMSWESQSAIVAKDQRRGRVGYIHQEADIRVHRLNVRF